MSLCLHKETPRPGPSQRRAGGFRVRDHLLDVERREPWRGGKPVALEPQIFDPLVYLVRNRHRVVSKDNLIEAIWGGRIVSESVIATRLNAARKAIGDSGTTQRLILTVPRRGLRFVGEVIERCAPVAADPALVPPEPPALTLPNKSSVVGRRAAWHVLRPWLSIQGPWRPGRYLAGSFI
jgi:DNA-binding winged helix-turn-helix (wHTH) protein